MDRDDAWVAEHDQALLGSLVSTPEILAMTGLSRQNLNNHIKRGTFPDPVLELGIGRIWTREAIENWEANRRPAHRPKKAQD